MHREAIVLSPDQLGGNAGGPAPAPAPTQPQVATGHGIGRPSYMGDPPPSKIQAFEQKLGGAKRHEESWKRSPNVTGTGAIHMKSFHSKLSDDALAFIDQQVNEWLDGHPQYEVKFVTTSIGEFQGKIGKEHHLIMQVWV